MNKQILVQDVTPPAKDDTNNDDLYVEREKIYTRVFAGISHRLRMVSGATFFFLYFGTVWLSWSDRQIVWWGLFERRFCIFGATFWPQDFILLPWLLIVYTLNLPFITVSTDRVWCSYTCPQSVWTRIYMWCEKITEGNRNQRIKLNKTPMSGNKLLCKTAEHSLWLLVGPITDLTFVGYFPSIRELIPGLLTGQADDWTYFWVGFFTLVTYGNAGWLREQVYICICPCTRFQSMVFGKDTPIVPYDPCRSEKHGPHKKSLDYKAQGLGGCIGRTMRVQVCPIGVDIRNGLRTECIGCAACIDACDSIMKEMNYPKGLINYTTEHNLNGQKTHLARSRLIDYAIALVLVISALITAMVLCPLAGFDVSKGRVFYRENELGRIENACSLKIMNEDQQDHTYVPGARGLEGLILESRRGLKVAAGDILNLPMELSIESEKLPSTANEVVSAIEPADDLNIHRGAESRFIGPRTR